MSRVSRGKRMTGISVVGTSLSIEYMPPPKSPISHPRRCLIPAPASPTGSFAVPRSGPGAASFLRPRLPQDRMYGSPTAQGLLSSLLFLTGAVNSLPEWRFSRHMPKKISRLPHPPTDNAGHSAKVHQSQGHQIIPQSHHHTKLIRYYSNCLYLFIFLYKK